MTFARPVFHLIISVAFAAPFLSPASAETPDSEAFATAFGEVCIPERLSYRGTLDTYLTFIPESSEVAAQTGFSGLMIKFSTSLPDRAEFEQ